MKLSNYMILPLKEEFLIEVDGLSGNYVEFEATDENEIDTTYLEDSILGVTLSSVEMYNSSSHKYTVKANYNLDTLIIENWELIKN